MRGGTNISKKLYTDNLGQNTTTDSAQAQYGDIVWLHTRNLHQKYRLPSDAEMRTLYEQANAKAAFCYLNPAHIPYGYDTTRIYGIYFWTNHGEPRIQNFSKSKDQYDDVSFLVATNRGLFLPFTGRRAVNSDQLEYRYMPYFGGAYGQYMSDCSNTNDVNSNWDFVFGSEWNYATKSKGEAKAIRPVWDETSDSTLNPVNTMLINQIKSFDLDHYGIYNVR